MDFRFTKSHLAPEQTCVEILLTALDWDDARAQRVNVLAKDIITHLRATKGGTTEIETFLQHYPLTSPEGLSLMSLAEAVLRVPDSDTADRLIAEKMAAGNWQQNDHESPFFKAAGIGLNLAQKTLGSFVGGLAKPVIRKAVMETIRGLGKQFVIGATIDDALSAAKKERADGYRVSFDMLGEGARTREDAARYFAAYRHAILEVGKQPQNGELQTRHGISVKLSALHPRYHWTQRATCVVEIAALLLELCKLAKEQNITLTVDAEESDRLEMSMEILSLVSSDVALKGWNGLGLAVQAYDKRCFALIDDVVDMARRDGRMMQVRLVKGAYWDGEIKRAQIAGWPRYAVFTRKHHTDLSYLACAQKLLARRDVLYPMFATHNAATVAAITDMAAGRDGFEFQRLFGMGKILGDWVCAKKLAQVTIYGPVGSYGDLLPYLVRRMLENGANTSFVAHIRDTETSIDTLVRDPVLAARGAVAARTESLPLPSHIYGTTRLNAAGHDLSLVQSYRDFAATLQAPRISLPALPDIDAVFGMAQSGFQNLRTTTADTRAKWLEKLAALMESRSGALIALLQTEGKKTLADAIAEVREAVDFCRYYAAEGRKHFDMGGVPLTGPTGESNHLRLMGRGVFVCIAPWNFPLAIFLGQVTAALMAGNSVLAKPAEQTPRIAAYAVALMHEVGMPKDAVILCCGGGCIGAALVAHPLVAGVAFTGSTEVARHINRALAAKDGPIVPLIAETGGQNAMIVDSTALPEQVVDDVILSAFGSAGQRCSALRVLYVQDDIADRVIDLLHGAMALLKVGNPQDSTTDVGPIIDAEARDKLIAHKNYLGSFAKKIAEAPLDSGLPDTFFAPIAYEIDSLDRLKGEVFGPVLHVIRYAADKRDDVVAAINRTGFGLTFGLHSRLESSFTPMADKIAAGNIYINRSMIGATVGVQPFGGQGLSGTGPKAGGPHYLPRFATEQVVSINTTATGGNIELLTKASS